MNELILISKTKINNEEVNAVNAKDLHTFLEIKTKFNDWINKRINEYDFANDIDYLKLSDRNYKGIGNAPIEYLISLDMAKELSMVERNEKGRQARKYFIECERKLNEKTPFKLPQTFSEALRLAAEQAEQIEEQQKVIEIQAPKAEFYDAVTQSHDTVDIGTAAKVLNKGIGRNKLFELLRNEKVPQQNNQPYQKFIDCGYFRQVESKFSKPDGTNCINIKTVVYQKGLNYISKLIDKARR